MLFVENADETHLVSNADNRKKLGFVGENHVKYLKAVSGI